MKYIFTFLILLILAGCAQQLSSQEEYFFNYCENNMDSNIDCSTFTEQMAYGEGGLVPDRCGGFSNNPVSCNLYMYEGNTLILDFSSSLDITSASVHNGVQEFTCNVETSTVECDITGDIPTHKHGYIITLQLENGQQAQGTVLL